jgi:hypothetical protein
MDSFEGLGHHPMTRMPDAQRGGIRWGVGWARGRGALALAKLL